MTPKLKKENRPIAANKFLTHDQLKELMHYIDQDKKDVGLLIIDILMQTGCRTEEVCRINRHSVDVNRGFISIQAAKRSIDREVPASRSLCLRILELYENSSLDDCVPLGLMLSNSDDIESQKRLIRLHWSKVRHRIWRGKVDLGLHALRHSFALYVYEQERDIWAVKTCLGHKSISSTQRYMPMFVGEKIADRLRSRFSK